MRHLRQPATAGWLGPLLLVLGCNPPQLPAAGSANDAAADVTRADAARDSGPADGPGADSDGSSVLSCASACHGSTQTPAPPPNLAGQNATTERGVGAHAAHLGSSSWHAPVQCDDCHLVPTAISSPGHMDSPQPAELTWSTLAQTDGTSPSWDGQRCSGVYCHGATLSAGSLTEPRWTQVDGTQAVCGTCHGLPPTAGHPASTACHTCHGAVVDAQQQIIAPALHIDGTVQVSGGGPHPTDYKAGSVHGADFLGQGPSACSACHGTDLAGGSGPSCGSCHSGWKTDCTFCHGGTDNASGAPPSSVAGATATNIAAVGRHTSHVMEGPAHKGYGCALCHKVPADALSPGHIDPSPAEVQLSGLGAGGSYNATSATCSNVYCHGTGKSGSTGSAVWTGTLNGCGGCHQITPTRGSTKSLSGRHEKHVVDKKLSCSTCHSCVVNAQQQITDKAAHVDSTIDVCGAAAWNPANRTCSPTCHGTKGWGGG